MCSGTPLGRWCFGGGCILAAVLGTAKPVRAAELKWSAPAECERTAAVEDKVEALVGRPLAEVAGLDFAVFITHEGDDWTLNLETTQGLGGTSTRTISGKSCSDVADAAAVVIGMAVRSLAPAPNADTAPSPSSPPPAPAAPKTGAPRDLHAPAVAAAPPAHGAPRHARRFEPMLLLGGVLDTSALPKLAPGITLLGGLRVAGLELELEGTALVPESRALGGGASGEFALVAGAALGCLAPEGNRVSVLGCVGIELGSMSGEGHGVTEPKLGDALWDALRFELGAEFPATSSLRLTARAGVAVPLARPEFQLEGREAYRPAPFGVRALLGVELWP